MSHLSKTSLGMVKNLDCLTKALEKMNIKQENCFSSNKNKVLVIKQSNDYLITFQWDENLESYEIIVDKDYFVLTPYPFEIFKIKLISKYLKELVIKNSQESNFIIDDIQETLNTNLTTKQTLIRLNRFHNNFIK